MKKLTKAALTRLTKKALNDDADAQFVLANVYRYQAADGVTEDDIVRLRTSKTRNCGSRNTTLAMVYKLLQSAQKRWNRLKGFQLLTLVVNNVKFQDGEQVMEQSDRKTA